MTHVNKQTKDGRRYNHFSAPHFCPACGQRVVPRLGVDLSPRRADVFDMIYRASKRGGICSDELEAVFGRSVVKVHVKDINKKLAEKGWQIVCERTGNARGFYRIRKARTEWTAQNTTVSALAKQPTTGQSVTRCAETLTILSARA